MDTVELEVQTRDTSMKVKDLRAQSLIPAEYYGRGVENKSIQMDYQTFRRVFNKAGSNTLITLKINGKDELTVLVHDFTMHPVTDEYTHVDFVNVRMGEAITTKVPLEFIGTAPAVKELAGIFTSHMNEVEVKCLPKDLIHSIEVPVESLVDFHTSIRVSDLKVPDTIEILHEMEDSVASVAAPQEEEEEEPVPAEGEEGEEGVEGEEGEEGGDEKKEGEEGGDEGEKKE